MRERIKLKKEAKKAILEEIELKQRSFENKKKYLKEKR